jgi:hypothetical protein
MICFANSFDFVRRTLSGIPLLLASLQGNQVRLKELRDIAALWQ